VRTGGEAAAARRHGRVAECSSLAACSLTGQRCRLDGRRGEGQRRGVAALGGSGAAGGQQRRSERVRVRAQVPARAERGKESEGERERREKKGVERENKSQRFGLVQTQNFQLKLEKF